ETVLYEHRHRENERRAMPCGERGMRADQEMLVRGRRIQDDCLLVDRFVHGVRELADEVHALAELRTVRNAGDPAFSARQKSETDALATELDCQLGRSDTAGGACRIL